MEAAKLWATETGAPSRNLDWMPPSIALPTEQTATEAAESGSVRLAAACMKAVDQGGGRRHDPAVGKALPASCPARTREVALRTRWIVSCGTSRLTTTMRRLFERERGVGPGVERASYDRPPGVSVRATSSAPSLPSSRPGKASPRRRPSSAGRAQPPGRPRPRSRSRRGAGPRGTPIAKRDRKGLGRAKERRASESKYIPAQPSERTTLPPQMRPRAGHERQLCCTLRSTSRRHRPSAFDQAPPWRPQKSQCPSRRRT